MNKVKRKSRAKQKAQPTTYRAAYKQKEENLHQWITRIIEKNKRRVKRQKLRVRMANR